MSQQNQPTETIQQKMTALSEAIAWFDGDEFTLEQAVERFRQAEALATDIEQDLATLKNEITIIKERFDRDSE